MAAMTPSWPPWEVTLWCAAGRATTQSCVRGVPTPALSRKYPAVIVMKAPAALARNRLKRNSWYAAVIYRMRKDGYNDDTKLPYLQCLLRKVASENGMAEFLRVRRRNGASYPPKPEMLVFCAPPAEQRAWKPPQPTLNGRRRRPKRFFAVSCEPGCQNAHFWTPRVSSGALIVRSRPWT